MTTPESFHAARDLLLRLRDDQAAAFSQFRWPVLREFNWALDHFDAIARGNDAPALWIVGEDGSEVKRSFAEMSQRSSQVANHLRGLGVKRGDRVLLMLGNELALWEVMLASIKLGAVLIPATSLLTTEDLRDRLDRGGVRHVVTASAQAAKFAPLEGGYTRIAVGPPVAGWQAYADSEKASTDFAPDGPTRADDPLLLYFTSGTTSKPKLVLHTQQSYPVGHLSTMYWLGLRAGRRAPEHLVAGLGQACLELLLRALDRGGLHLHLQQRALQRAAVCWRRSSATASPACARRPPSGAC